MEKNGKTVLDHIREFFGEDLSPDLINSIDKVSITQLEEFGKIIHHAERCPCIPSKTPGEIQPFMTHQCLQDIAFQTGVAMSTGTAFEGQEFSQGRIADLVKRMLLYSHRITLFDPLPYIADYFVMGSKQSMNQFVNYLSWLHEIKPLVEDGTVSFLSELGYKQSTGVDTLDARILEEEVLRQLESKVTENGLFEGDKKHLRFYIGNAQESFWEMGYALTRFPANLDFYLAHGFYREVLKEYIIHSSLEKKISIDHSSILRSLLSISVPNLDSLSISDICRVRGNEQIFESWRKDLRHALSFARNNDDIIGNNNSEQARIVNEELKERALLLGENLKKDKWVEKTKSGLKGFTIGCVAAFTKTGIAGVDPYSAAITPIVSTLLSVIWPSANSNRDNEAMLNHYVAFDELKD